MEIFRQNLVSGLELAMLRKLDSEDFEVTVPQTIIWLLLLNAFYIAVDVTMTLVPNSDTEFDPTYTFVAILFMLIGYLIVAVIERRVLAFGALVIAIVAGTLPIWLLYFGFETALHATGFYPDLDAINDPKRTTATVVHAILYLVVSLAISVWWLVVMYRAIACALDAGWARTSAYFLLILAVECLPSAYFIYSAV